MISTTDKIRVGVLGCSELAARRFLPAIVKEERTTLRAVGNKDMAVLHRFFPDADCEMMSYEDLIEQQDIDLIYIALPSYLHERWTLRALESGKHVICEKPLGLSYESVCRMTAYAEQRRLLLYGSMRHLHHPQHAAVKNIIASGRIGDIRILRAGYGSPPKKLEKIGMRSEWGRSIFFEVIRYPLSLVSYVLDSAIAECAGYTLIRDGLPTGIHGHALTRHNAVLDLSITFAQEREAFYEIVGERGTIRLDHAYAPPPDMENLIRITSNARHATVVVPQADQFALMIDAVCSAIDSGNDFHQHYEDAKRLAFEAEQLKTGCKEVQVDDRSDVR